MCAVRFPVRPLSFNSHDVGEEDNYFLDMDAPPHHHMPPQVSNITWTYSHIITPLHRSALEKKTQIDFA
jgi:hypothetical protein